MKQKITLLAVILFSLISNAQVKQEEPTKEAPSRIKVYTPSSSASSSSKDNSYKWAVKTDIFGIISGEFPIIAEYRIASKFSVEASAGITYAFYPNNFSFSGDDEDMSSYYDTKAAMGTAFRGAIKYYPSSDFDAIEGWSFGVQLFSKTTNREYILDSNDTNISTLDGKKDSKTKTGISLIIGKQIFQDSNVTFESYIGIGFANVTREYFTEQYNSDTSNYDLRTVETKESVPNVQFGFRIGFGN
jgi:hypothetical protein